MTSTNKNNEKTKQNEKAENYLVQPPPPPPPLFNINVAKNVANTYITLIDTFPRTKS